ncbi:dtw domain-containing protein 2 [Limosa lapponica baueri]|uniref:Dtw domain-containing protein 2 n=1 Tax=Limosa lapponica baueri TaxID=1758121 RepID=A0A2I0TTG4_LIMLA|nr:dtw domain-containing protein 2 [Limosa lapponica baueri]
MRRGVALYVNDQLECMELHLGMDEEPTENLWVRIKGSTGAGNVTVGVCYRPPDQDNGAIEALYRQIGVALCSHTLVLMGNFNHPDICWKDNTAGHKKSRKFLECVDDNFLLQMVEEPMRRGAMLDLILTNKEGLVGNVKLKGSLGCSDHKVVEFKIFKASRMGHSKLTTLDFRRADLGLLRDLLGRKVYCILQRPHPKLLWIASFSLKEIGENRAGSELQRCHLQSSEENIGTS